GGGGGGGAGSGSPMILLGPAAQGPRHSSRSRWSEELEQQPCGGISVEPATKGGLVTLQQLAGVVEGVATCSSDSHYYCLDQFSSDPAFAERAAKFSSFSNNNNVDDGGTTLYSQMINSHHPLAALPFRQTTSDCIIVKSRDQRQKENEKPSCILMQTSKPPCTTSSAAAAASNKKVDYVHVRARRGQATDSHSLAERVRREKISERMKYLQELVPGCSKVTGKAVMLDEIINYVQSLRRQVEFLSMKLASVNSQLDFNLDSILNKEMLWSQDSAVLLPEPSLSYGLHLPPLIQQHLATDGPDFQSLATIDTLLCRRTMSAPISVPCAPNADAFGDDPSTQMSTEWDGELQTMFQMGFGQFSRATPLMEGSFNTCHMKVEL
ncbi:unnamed protein product, partial [Sphagnum jensenii]